MVKFLGSFQTTLEFGHVVIVGGSVSENSENFILNLLSDDPKSDIPFHMNFVFGDNCQVIRNSKINGDFGVAETLPGMLTKQLNPLKSGDVYKFCHNVT
jgi:hypothetical protein